MQWRISSSQPVICLFWLLLVLSLSSSCIYASEEEDYIEEENDYQEYYDGDYDYEDDLASGDTAPSGLVMNSVTRKPEKFRENTQIHEFVRFHEIFKTLFYTFHIYLVFGYPKTSLFSDDDEEEYIYAYNYEDYKENESELDIIPEMTSLPQSLIIQRGETAHLPCKASDSSQLVRIWQRQDGHVLFTGGVKVSRDDNYFLDPEDNTTLVITNGQPHDAGGYTCRVMIRARDEISLTHRLIVNTHSFKITPVPDDGLMTAVEGADALLECKVSGEDVVPSEEINGTVRWTREGTKFRDGSYTAIGDLTLPLVNVTMEDGGKYFCTATSSKGESKSTNIDVIVQFRPSIKSITKSIIQTGRGLQGEINCLTLGEPQPKVTWYKGNEVIKLNDRITAETAGKRHILLLDRLRSDDLGTYMCYTINELGSAQKVLELTMEDLLLLEQEAEEEDLQEEEEIVTKEPNVESHVNLEQDEVRRQDVLNSFQAKIQSDIDVLRNLTYRALEQQSQSHPDIDSSVFVDLQQLQLQLRQFQGLSENHMREIKQFKRTAKDDFQRLWDHVNELQEITNVTTKTIEEIYDKDILPLQNFKAAAENDMKKVREEMDDFIALTSNNPSGGNASEEIISILTRTKRKLDLLENEQNRQKDLLEKLQESQSIRQAEIHTIFEDIDNFKKQTQSMNQNQLKLERELSRIENIKITDLTNLIDIQQRQIDDLHSSRDKLKEEFQESEAQTDAKFSVLVKELQTVKSQIYYLQQSVLQLRGAVNHDESTTRGSITPLLLSSDLNNEKLAQMESKLDQCALQDDLMNLQQTVEDKTQEFHGSMNLLNDQIKTMDDGIDSMISQTDSNTLRIEDIEKNERKNNLIIKGIPQDRRLERPSHLQGMVKKLFKQSLKLSGVHFEEVERLKPTNEGDVINQGAPLRVKFSNVREKIKVLQASRNASQTLKDERISIIEDFTDKVLRHRQALARFARRRARKTKQKWALKYDQLYFNGRVFVFNEKTRQVEAKSV